MPTVDRRQFLKLAAALGATLAALWQVGERPRMQQTVVEGDVGLAL